MPDPQRRAAMAALDAALAASTGFAGFRPEALLAWQPRGTVARGVLDGRVAYVKHLHRPDAADQIALIQAELAFLAAHPVAGRPLMTPHLLSDADAGLIAVAAAPGRVLGDAIAAADPAGRQRLMALAGAWLGDYARLRQRRAKLRPRRDLQGFGRIAARLGGADGRRIEALAASQDARIGRLRGKPVTLACVHGDFHPRNLTVDDGVLHGFDSEGASWLPVMRAAARFLTQTQMAAPAPGGPHRWGIAQVDCNSFLAGLGAPPDEAETLLPAFIAEELAGILWRARSPGRRRLRARRMVDGFLADPG